MIKLQKLLFTFDDIMHLDDVNYIEKISRNEISQLQILNFLINKYFNCVKNILYTNLFFIIMEYYYDF